MLNSLESIIEPLNLVNQYHVKILYWSYFEVCKNHVVSFADLACHTGETIFTSFLLEGYVKCIEYKNKVFAIQWITQCTVFLFLLYGFFGLNSKYNEHRCMQL